MSENSISLDEGGQRAKKIVKDEFSDRYYAVVHVSQARPVGYRTVHYHLDCGHLKIVQELPLLGHTAQSYAEQAQREHESMRCYECGEQERKVRAEKRKQASQKARMIDE